jgi:transcription antitermination factor NusA-like protein
MIVTRRPRVHTTKEELFYIENIGQFSETTMEIPRKEMLTNYIEALKLKKKWGDVDKIKVLSFAYSELAKEK